MNKWIAIGVGVLTGLGMALPEVARAGWFRNLDFEEGSLVPVGPFGDVSAAAAFPGWTVRYGNTPVSVVAHNRKSIGEPIVAIFTGEPGFGTLQGNFTPWLETMFGPPRTTVSLTQTADVPPLVQSLRLISIYYPGRSESDLPVVRIDGNLITPVLLQRLSTVYDIWEFGLDLRPFAGTMVELRYESTLFGIGGDYFDSTGFSAIAIPEPGTAAIITSVAVLLGRRIRKPTDRARQTEGSAGFGLESLEPRSLLSLTVPIIQSARALDMRTQTGEQYSYSELFVVNNSDAEAGHRIEWSADGSQWPAPGSAYDSGTDDFGVLPLVAASSGVGSLLTVEHRLNAGQKLWYRAQAVDSIPSGVAQRSPSQCPRGSELWRRRGRRTRFSRSRRLRSGDLPARGLTGSLHSIREVRPNSKCIGRTVAWTLKLAALGASAGSGAGLPFHCPGEVRRCRSSPGTGWSIWSKGTP